MNSQGLAHFSQGGESWMQVRNQSQENRRQASLSIFYHLLHARGGLLGELALFTRASLSTSCEMKMVTPGTRQCQECALWRNYARTPLKGSYHQCLFITVEHHWTNLPNVKSRLGVMEQVLCLNGEAFCWELPGSDAPCYCHSTFLKHVGVPNEIIYLMSW